MITGNMIIGSSSTKGRESSFKAFNPSTASEIEPEFGTAHVVDVRTACALAEAAFPALCHSSPTMRADFLETIASKITASGPAIIERALLETGLPRMRLEGELGRTTNQLRLFATTLRDGGYLGVRIDHALPERTPPRPDLRLLHVALGPVAVFSASNFPLAFSVAGGDTASALAAGCPVIVKAHSAHPGTSELVGQAIQQAVSECGLPEGTFSLLFGRGNLIGTTLVTDPAIQAVGFTGSRSGGLALVAATQGRAQPIPVYAEMSSINPVVLLPAALKERGEVIGKAFASALTLGAGQFCTNPGLLLALEGPELESFVQEAGLALAEIPGATMLSDGIYQAYCRGVDALEGKDAVQRIAQGTSNGGLVAKPLLFSTTATEFLADNSLRDEVFGATSLLVRCADLTELKTTLAQLEGQLTVSIHCTEADAEAATEILPFAERIAGRVLFNGFGTGVEVCDAMVHGGPFPATSDVKTTSVGSLAIMRFVRPICYQDVPAELLPAVVKDDNPLNIPRIVNGKRG